MRKKNKAIPHVDHLELRQLLSTVFVSAAAPGVTQDGTSWATAYTSLQAALAVATSGTTIEVGQGTYKPTTTTDRTISFDMVSGVQILGGYEGYGAANPDTRDPAVYTTTLSGDIGTTGDNSDNSYHVVYAGATVDSTAALDGFTITDGNADGAGNARYHGGGFLDQGGSPEVSNCTITGNSAFFGGGVNNYDTGSPEFVDCLIAGNTAIHYGGGVINGAHTDATFINTTITDNNADHGGGMSSFNSTVNLTNSILWGNKSPIASQDEMTGSATTYNISYSDIDQTGYAGSNGNIDANPEFVDASSGNYAVQPYSPVVDAGNNSAVPVDVTSDLAGNNRFQDVPSSAHTGSGTSPLVDMGAYEATAALAATTGGPYKVLAGQSIELSGLGSSTHAGGLTYGWSLDNDANFADLSGAQPTFSSNGYTAGTLVPITVQVTDANNNTVTSSSDILIVPSTVYVDTTATGTNDGTSWNNAYPTLQQALDNAVPGVTIEVAQGTYYPTTGTDRSASFDLMDGVTIEGGFAGHSASNPNTRNPLVYATILSGDIGTQGSNTDNSYHVVASDENDSTAILDGFTITAGNASGDYGTFAGGGGGILNTYSNAAIRDCTITGNHASQGGGVQNYYSAPDFVNDIFSANTAVVGAGIFNDGSGSPDFINNTVSGNTASEDGGAMTNFGGATPVVVNSILWGDTAGNGNEVYNDTHSANSATITYSDVDGGFAGTGNINSDPLFARNPGTNGATDAGDLDLQDNSPAINAGSNAAVADVSTDLVGNSRIINGTVDMGAIESTSSALDVATAPPNSVTAGQTFSVVIDIKDADGDIVTTDNSNITIGISTGPNGGAISGTKTVAAQSGVATFTGLSLNKVGTYTLEFTDGSLPDAEVSGISVSAGSPSTVVILQQPTTTTAGQTIGAIEVELTDQFGNLISGSDSFTAGIANGPTGATLSGTKSENTSNGIATFSDLSLTKAGQYSLVFTDSNSDSGDTNTFMINPAAASQMSFTTTPTAGAAGQTLSNVQVTLEDQYGNIATTDTSSVTLSLTSGGTLHGTVTEPVSNGAATFSDLSITKAGEATLTAADGSLAAATSGAFPISAGAAASLTIVSQPSSGIASQALSAFSVEVEDANGNPVDGAAVTLSLASEPSLGALSGTLSETSSSGIATFSDLTLNRAGSYTVTASDGSLSATSSAIAITYASPTVVFVSEPGNTVAGQKIAAFTVSPETTTGSVITTDKSKVTLQISSGGKLIGTSKGKVKNGLITFKNLSIRTAGTYTLTATDPSYASMVSTSFTISAGAASKMSFKTQPTNVAASTPFNVTVGLTDKYGNAVSDNSTVTLVLGSKPKGAAALSLTATVSDGSADFDGVTLATGGNYTLKASDGKAKATSKKIVVS
ncbi:MAG TPA: choice-of-anchor Q domain-containing protein [Tepidisphaeraceae bacterium]|jgi:hypothetical protein